MSKFIQPHEDGFTWQREHERVWVQAWGKNGVRVRITRNADFRDLPQGLLDDPPAPGKTELEHNDNEATLTNGNLTVNLATRFGRLTFTRSSDGEQLLQECKKTTAEHHGRTFVPRGNTFEVEHRFVADDQEKFFGLGQRQHGMLDQKGCVLDLMHRNTEVSIPFLVSNKGYGFLWNHPGLGEVSLGRNETRWTARAVHQLDFYVVCEPTPGEILERYAEVTGMPSEFPEWAAGFWQCKLRYKTQEEFLEVAREYHRRELPVSVMVIDFHHWVHSGDWAFDPECWPDPKAMVDELESMGMKCMVSIWPTVNKESENFQPMKEQGMLLRNERGNPLQNGMALESFYDATHPEARKYLMEQVKKNYIDDGIRYFWLDTMEPEILPLELDNTRFYLGTGNEVAALYPKCHFQAFYEGLQELGEEAPLTLGRSAWVGSQSYGGAVWSADIPSTFESLARQIAGGLNIAMSGIPWWTTDIGGFHGGDIDDPEFRELLVRWFQYGVFCPIMRLHGIRRQKINPPKEDPGKADPNHPNVPNEVWSYGDEVCEILSDLIHLRDRLKPYIMEQMKVAETTGRPPMRPLFVDFSDDPQTWEVEDQFMFGPEILVAPIVELGAREREVYLPAGTRWRSAWTGEEHDGGTTLTADAPLEQIPVFLTADSDLNLRGD
ncbi:MAG: glycoside hydrolase family 31 protein [Phycisphaeraceae bacterium]|nr:glycoside hydrolase family 31 protein [Phycisphaeraceae bacterium]